MSPLLDSEKSIEKKVEHPPQPAMVESKNLIHFFVLYYICIYFSIF